MVGSEVGGQIKTRVDELIALISEKGQISAPDAAKELSVDQEMVESWARFLDKSADIRIVYKGLTPTLVAIEASENEVQDPALEDRASTSGWQMFTSSISAQLDRIRDAIEKKAYAGITPAIESMRSQLSKIKERLEQASVEEQDRKALERSIERVTGRIENVEKHSDGKRANKLASESKRLAKDVDELSKRLEKLPAPAEKAAPKPAPKPAPHDPSEPEFESRVEQLEQEAREALGSGDVKHAEELRARIEELYEETLPHQYAQIRSHLKERLYALKQDLTFAGDESDKKAFARLKERIEQLLDRYEEAITASQWDEVASLERSFIEAYNALPLGYESDKKRFEERFGSHIIEAAKKRRSELNERIDGIRSALEQGKRALAESIEQGNFTTANETYSNLRALLEHIPVELVIERIDVQRELLEEFERLTSAFKERFIARNEAHIERCTHLIESVKQALADGDIEAARSAYESANDVLSRIDHNYFEQRSRLQYDLMKVHKALLDAKAKDAEHVFEEVVSRFQQTLKDGRGYLVSKETQLAESIYLTLLELYRQLPAGHEERKNALKQQVFDYYQELNAIDEQTKSGSTSLNDILERLVTIHHAINAGDPSVLSGDLKRVEQLIEALPKDLKRENPTLEHELVRLSHLRYIYEKALEASSALDRGEQPEELASFIDESEAWIESESVNAASIVMMLRALRARLPEAPRPEDPVETEPQDAVERLPHLEPRESRVEDITSRIEAIRSLLKE